MVSQPLLFEQGDRTRDIRARVTSYGQPTTIETAEMPIYEYTCKACDHQFEALVRSGKTPVCAACGSVDLERLLSLPTVKSEGTHARALGAAKRRDSAQAKDITHEQVKYERSHND
jgi:putative FmdB family regulatory protein